MVEHKIKELALKLTDMSDSSIMPQMIEKVVREIAEEQERYISKVLMELNIDEGILAKQTQEIWRLNDLLREYKDLEEQGLLLRLPCKVGDTIYRIGEYKIYEPSKESEQREWVLVREERKIYEQPFSLYDLRLIGETVFLTREEAEQKLKEAEE